ncbi:MAG: hypothetical protein ABIL58_00545 [Pseudomonadota bacterium]
MPGVNTRFSQTIFLDSATHEIIFEWRTGMSGGVIEVIKVSRGVVELKGIALHNFWSMLNIDRTLSVEVIPNIQDDEYGHH